MSERNCVNCMHWQWSCGHGAYSDVTPGWGWHSDCAKGHWSMQGDNVSEETFRENMRAARRCSDYRERVPEMPAIADFGYARQILVRYGKDWRVMELADCTVEAMKLVDEWRRIG